ncbi:MAG: acetyl/propionyl/methylcrotonyl-CoA carboxylase subunit alpha [Pseudomonadales bacterium]
MFRRVLIANRGAIARRVVEACAGLGIETVAVYSDADAGAPHLAEASATWRLPGERAVDTYLNQAALLTALEETGADALHPGYGFLAENGAFARAVTARDVRFIGPDPAWLETMGDKVAARALAAAHGFPVFAGSDRLTDVEAICAAADAIGYPVMLKPAAGGGGIGMSVVRSAAELRRAVGRSALLAERAFGDGGLFVERWVEAARHIEFQMLGDGQGGAIHVHERECSVQRRNQKVIEESPAPGIGRAEIESMAERARDFVAGIGYDNVGTLETLRAGSGDYGFLEMNTRIQVEHAVTEMVTGLDLVAAQIRLAAGEPLPAPVGLNGHAVEVRIYAEHPRTLLPSTGRLAVFEPPRGLHGVRVDTGYRAGQWITPHYDPLLAKVVAHGRTREQAIGRVVVALKAFAVQGVHTNIALLEAVLGDSDFLSGRLDTGYLTRLLENLPESARV